MKSKEAREYASKYCPTTATAYLAGFDAREAEVQKLKAQLEKAKKALRFTLSAAEYLYKPDKELKQGLDPTFYFTLTYLGDLNLIAETLLARETLRELEGK